MIKRGILVPLAALFILVGCGQKGTSVKGNLVNAEGETVRLERLSSTASTPVDSAEVSSEGDFKLSAGEITEAGFYRFKINENNFVILLLDKGENVELNGNALDFYQSYEVQGSEGSAKLRSLDQRLRADYNKTDSLRKSFQAFQQQGHPRLDSIAQSIDVVFQKMQAKKREFILGFIDENPNSLVALSAVQSLNPAEDLEVFEQLAENLTETMPESDYVKKFKTQLIDMRSKQQAAGRTEIGAEAPEMVLKTPEGETIKLSDFRGKVTMIDFWAAWCKPCRMENPNVVRVYNKYKEKGFEIFGVSLDQDGQKWVDAIAQDGLTWKHGSELKFWQSSFVPAYSLDGIPMTYLLDENGVIIAKGLRGDQLEQKLKEIFG
ncbi:AhpC/TSA family protein [Flavobacteriales bacterium]|nr:AhpC/TSA family protein [Flavobacteriales bacterium]